MTATLPYAVQDVFSRFVTTELTTIDARGRPITWPVTPYYSAGDPSIPVTTPLGYPRKARDAARNPKVALLFSDPTGSGIERPSMVLVQGIADVDDRDLAANRERYARDHAAKMGRHELPPASIQRRFDWYYTRIYIGVRPERVYVWRAGDIGVAPERLDLPESAPAPPEADSRPSEPAGRRGFWDPRLRELGRRYESAVLSFVGPDGFPFAVRVPVEADRRARVIHIDSAPAGVPLRPGVACMTAHDHDATLRWQRNFQVRGQLAQGATGSWGLVPHRLVQGFELPPGGALTRAISNFAKIRRFRRTAKRELARRAVGGGG